MSDGGLLSLLMIHTTSMLLNGFLNVLVLRLIGKKKRIEKRIENPWQNSSSSSSRRRTFSWLFSFSSSFFVERVWMSENFTIFTQRFHNFSSWKGVSRHCPQWRSSRRTKGGSSASRNERRRKRKEEEENLVAPPSIHPISPPSSLVPFFHVDISLPSQWKWKNPFDNYFIH